MLDPRLKYLSHKQVRENSWDLVLLPFGATEPHNLHLPYGTDIFQVEEIGRRGCVKANEKGAKALLLPAIPFGVNTNYYQIPGGLTPGLKPTTLLAIIKDVATALSRQGIRKLVLLNGHGGNELKPFLRELFDELPIFIGLIDWYRMAGDLCKATLTEPGEHADELETSLMLALRPELVNMTVADDGTLDNRTRLYQRSAGKDSIDHGCVLLDGYIVPQNGACDPGGGPNGASAAGHQRPGQLCAGSHHRPRAQHHWRGQSSVGRHAGTGDREAACWPVVRQAAR